MIKTILSSLFLALLVPVFAEAPPAPSRRTAPRPAAFEGLPLAFEANLGQTDEVARFIGRGRDYNVFLTASDAIVAPPGAGRPIRLALAGANRQPRLRPIDRKAAGINYLRGSDPSRWQRHVPSYGRVRYERVYPGIDVEYDGTDGQLEYDFLVGRGADPSRIQIELTGGQGLAISDAGDLTVNLGDRPMVLRKPVAYQDVAGRRRPVDARYTQVGPHAVRFELGPYDRSEPLVIDPVLAFSTYYGGAADDFGFDIAVDSAGNMYVTGTTQSLDFPTTAGAISRTYAGPSSPILDGDAFVVKLSPSGALVYATYLGGSARDGAHGIAVDSSGSAYVTGGTGSINFPTTTGSVQPKNGNSPFGSFGDGFVSKLDATGSSLVYSTYLGGISLTEGNDIAVDAAGNAYVVGDVAFTFNTTNPLVKQSTAGGTDAFVVKINAAGSGLAYSKLLGGTLGDDGFGIAIDAGGNAYVTGFTGSNNFPTLNAADATFSGSSDGYIAKLDPSGSILYSSYVGGTGRETGAGIGIDGTGNAYITGGTSSTDFPVTIGALRTTAAGSDAFVSKYSPSGVVVYATYLGGSSGENIGASKGLDASGAIAVDSAGTAYVTGSTFSSNFPVVGAIQGTHASGTGSEIFVSRLNAAGSALLFSTYLGGATGTEEAHAIAIDASGNMYITGRTRSTDWPTLSPTQSTNKGSGDILIARISPASKPDVTVDRGTLVFAVTTTGTGSARTAGPITPPQPLRLAQSGAGLVSWTATSNQSWLSVSPASGTTPAKLTATASVASGIPSGSTATGRITFTLTGASTATATVDVTLNITDNGSSPPPIGTIDTPADGSVLAGSVAVTGWSLDNIGVKRVELWRDLQPGEPTPTFNSPGDPRNGKIFISNATFVDGARPDVEGLYASMPFAYRGGWEILMLTWGLYNSGNGNYKLYAFSFDQEDHVTTLGVKSVTINNNAATKPFGSIDTPAIGGDASGPNFGWGLTPKVNGVASCKIQSNGIQVSIDSGPLQPVVFGDVRSDLAGAFPGFSNSAAAGGHFLFDWSTLTNGPHTIGWLVTDDCGRADGVGSRFFNVTTGTSLVAAPAEFRLRPETTRESVALSSGPVASARTDTTLLVARGYGELPEAARPGDDGTYRIDLKLGDRIELRLPKKYETAHQVVAGQEHPLPLGSTWDPASGTFYWQPAPAFMGPYQLVFGNGRERISVRVVVMP